MDREKAIEEMAMLLCKDMCHKKVCATAGRCALKNCIIREKAALLYGFVVRQINSFIPCGAVVLTREELVKTMESGYVYNTTSGDKINLIEMAREIERKENAREILSTMLKEINDIYDSQYQAEAKRELVKVAEKYGVEVE